MSSSASDKFLCFLAGLGVGGVCALLLAPQSGKDTREELSRRAQEGREFLNRKVEEGRHLVEESGRRVSTEVTSVVERGREEVTGIVEKSKQAVSKQKDQLAAAYEAGKEAYREEKGKGA